MASKSLYPEYPKVKIEYHIVTPLGRCSMIYADKDRAVQHPLYSGWKVIKVTTTEYDITPMTAEEIDYSIDHNWSLPDYLTFINRDQEHPLLTEDLDHWFEAGITTPRQLADYLDAQCVESVASVDDYFI